MLPIEIDALSKTYKDKRGRKVMALDDLNLQIGQGEVFGFLGPNGAGKSTTIKTLVGLIRATAGRASVFGHSVTDAICRRRIGYLPENPAFYDFLSARQFLALVGNSFGMDVAAIRTESDRVLELLDLRHADCRPIRGYSKGMVQRLGLAQALLHDPDLYILDEPMSGLDPLGRALVKQIMSDLKARGRTVFFSTHVTADVEAVCDRVAVIVGGKLQTVNDVQDILEKGIEGYSVQLAGCPLSVLEDFDVSTRTGDVVDVHVPKGDLNRFMELVIRSGGRIQLMEPNRRNLEKFFLDIVERETR
jgi:ABC-2 type transport system ATP-binding protein